ncbi:hypothetical protein GUITHDRAFT_87626 [Guillardia theta CCMP2712]|uniref:Uncharacterized protein n=3 Tax=Guillardia theta TaxID=55529 RepID=L1J6S8_GUITC|nr:hypothetical protein GUITHDRAFT_87626 [Guillardia theta CCMP2712]EKX44047.1 hypothetical protein GUITHDRAFT_87626 [Guillardia theta CCMP2712]|eukprot:XP_005831027.1 hypothetical protein GUITHDRAFT_87626 [Guillardia theta CCMP2712]
MIEIDRSGVELSSAVDNQDVVLALRVVSPKMELDDLTSIMREVEGGKDGPAPTSTQFSTRETEVSETSHSDLLGCEHDMSLVKQEGCWSRVKPYVGSGALVAVGYMDPGNWATDLQAGSAYNYQLLFVVLLSSIIAMFVQTLSLRLGLVTKLDLAQACRLRYSKWTYRFLWVTAQLAVCACDLAEVIGSAIAFNLLFGIPLIWGVVITAFDVLVLLVIGENRMRIIEVLIVAMITTICVCFAVELAFARPDGIEMLKGCFVPSASLITNPGMLFVGVGILGATVMPQNLYLHSSLVQVRDKSKSSSAIAKAVLYSTMDCNLSLVLAFFVNAAILVVSAATFYRSGHNDVADIGQASELLSRVLGSKLSSILFGCALLASGQQSTITGTLAGQVVMEGFLNKKVKGYILRIGTRLVAILPALIMLLATGDGGVNNLLIISQIVLSLQLPFAVVPLVMFTGNKQLMGEYANSKVTQVIAWLVALIIIALNGTLVVQSFQGSR